MQVLYKRAADESAHQGHWSRKTSAVIGIRLLALCMAAEKQPILASGKLRTIRIKVVQKLILEASGQE
jgi:hypothetical protein